jgi:putative FmdB family regulatory protein
MPIYEYECRKCAGRTQFLERVGSARWLPFARKCEHCGSRRLKRTISAFATRRNESMSDILNEMNRMGSVNFVPRPPGGGPPPGGCPYEQHAKEGSKDGT